jgi:hypothetical protein
MHVIAFPIVSMMSKIVMRALKTKVSFIHNQESQDNHTKCCQTATCWLITLLESGLIHSNQFENKIGQCREEYSDDHPHGNLLFPPGTPCSQCEKGNSNWKGSNRNVELIILVAIDKISSFVSGCGCNDNDELDCKPDKEEKVKLQESDENLPKWLVLENIE